MPKINDIVLVHGGFVDGAGWRGVYDILKEDGFNVSVVREAETFIERRGGHKGRICPIGQQRTMTRDCLMKQALRPVSF